MNCVSEALLSETSVGESQVPCTLRRLYLLSLLLSVDSTPCMLVAVFYGYKNWKYGQKKHCFLNAFARCWLEGTCISLKAATRLSCWIQDVIDSDEILTPGPINFPKQFQSSNISSVFLTLSTAEKTAYPWLAASCDPPDWFSDSTRYDTRSPRHLNK